MVGIVPRSQSCLLMSGAARRSSTFSQQRTSEGRASPPVAEDEEAAASEASEWESRECEEHLAALREEEERLGEWSRRWISFSFFLSLIFFNFSLSFLFRHFWRIAGMRLQLDGSSFCLRPCPRHYGSLRSPSCCGFLIHQQKIVAPGGLHLLPGAA